MKLRILIIICLFLSVSGCISPAIATDKSMYDFQEDQIDQVDPELDDSFNMPPGDVIIDTSPAEIEIPEGIKAAEGCVEELNNLHGTEGLEILATYIAQHFNHQLGAATTAEGVMKTGYGDCWGLSDFAKETLVKNGYRVKLVQSVTREASNHRYLEVQDDEIQQNSHGWITFDPSHVTQKYGYGPYYQHFGKKTATLEVYP